MLGLVRLCGLKVYLGIQVRLEVVHNELEHSEEDEGGGGAGGRDRRLIHELRQRTEHQLPSGKCQIDNYNVI